jgi:hypothetical protein
LPTLDVPREVVNTSGFIYNVRAFPSAGAKIIARLHPDQRLPFAFATARWLAVELHGDPGKQGYVWAACCRIEP